MTRFEQDYNGTNGEFWKREAHEEAKRLLASRDQMTIEDDGAAKWTASGNYLPNDICDKLTFLGADWFDAEATKTKRHEQVKEKIASGRFTYYPTSEELAEMRSAFGVGETVVNVMSGQMFTV